MGLLENFGKNVGGARGGLLAAGESLSVMAQSLAQPGQGGNIGAALGAGTQTLSRAFGVQKERLRQDEFKSDARARAELLPEGSRERQLWETIGTGSPEALAMIPKFWAAQSYDAKIAAGGKPKGPTVAQARRNADRIEGRRLITEVKIDPSMAAVFKKQMGVENYTRLITLASERLAGVDDPDHALYFRKAHMSTFAEMAGLTPPSGSVETNASGPGADAGEGDGGFLDGLTSFFGYGADEPASSPEDSIDSALAAALGQTAAPSESVPEPTSIPESLLTIEEPTDMSFRRPRSKGRDLYRRSDEIRSAASGDRQRLISRMMEQAGGPDTGIRQLPVRQPVEQGMGFFEGLQDSWPPDPDPGVELGRNARRNFGRGMRKGFGFE